MNGLTNIQFCGHLSGLYLDILYFQFQGGLINVVTFGIDIRVFSKGSPLSTGFNYDFSSVIRHFGFAAEHETYKLKFFCPKGTYWYRYKLAKHDLDVIVYKDLNDLRKQSWLYGCRVVFTEDFKLLSVLRLLCRKYYPGALEDFYEEISRDTSRSKLYT